MPTTPLRIGFTILLVGGACALSNHIRAEFVCGDGEYQQYESSYTVATQVCVEVEYGEPVGGTECFGWQTTTYDVYSCHRLPGEGEGGGTGGSPGGGGGGSGGNSNPKDLDNDNEIDCWEQVVEGDPTKEPLGPDQGAGSEYGGPNSIRRCHSGIDVDCAINDPVYAARGGTVYYAGDKGAGNGGKMVAIQGDDGRWYDVLHLNSWTVTAGQTVRAGDLIGYCGDTDASYPHVHLRVMERGTSSPNCPQDAGWVIKNPETEIPCP